MQRKPNDLTLVLTGNAIVTQEFAKLEDWRVCAVDNDPNSNSTLTKDILKLDPSADLPFVPDFIWASPPCQTYSKLAGGRHRGMKPGTFNRTEASHHHDKLFTKMVEIIKWAKVRGFIILLRWFSMKASLLSAFCVVKLTFRKTTLLQKKHPHLIVVIENPVGLLQHMPLMQELENMIPELSMLRIHYCAFGRDEKKPTHLWTNDSRLRNDLSKFTCKKRCQLRDRDAHIPTRELMKDYDVGSIPDMLAREVAHQVDASLLRQDIRFEPASEP